jgi:hypothetical protein
MQQGLSLKSLLVPTKTIEIDYPGMPGFKIKLGFLSREILLNIRKKSNKVTVKNRQTQEEFDDDLFIQLYTDNAIKGWSGLKLRYLEQLAPVDLSGQDLDSELEYTQENALYLMRNSTNFDSFVSDTVSDLGNFSKTN